MHPIELKDVAKHFFTMDGGVVRAVDGLTLSVRKGEIFGLLGPNGAGKTTTLRLISTVLAPTSGVVFVDGIDTRHEALIVRRSLGFLSGDTGLYKRLTAREMVYFFGRLYGMNNEVLRRRTDKLFEQLDMTEYADTLCEKLSSGTKQKVSIARTIVHNPSILVLDEPTIGLDVVVAEKLLGMIRELKNDGKTIIFSTHIMEEASSLCDRLGVIARGKLVESGTVGEIVKRQGASNLRDVFLKLVGTHYAE